MVLGGDPIANPGGPYAALVGETITFDGTGSTDDGQIVQYDWVFGDGASAVDAGPNPQHAYDAEGVYNVVLTVTDNDGNTNAEATTATISPLELLDLDIDTLKVARTGRVGSRITVQLSVKNNGTVLGQALATVVGKQGGEEVYRWRLNVYDYIGKGTTSFTFPAYTPEAAGTIAWTADIADEDPDNDLVTATTVVK
jgi:PKD repeat protein